MRPSAGSVEAVDTSSALKTTPNFSSYSTSISM